MRSRVPLGAQACFVLAWLFALAPSLQAGQFRLGVVLGERPRPGYHKIGKVLKGSPAEAIALQAGHVIVAIDGRVVADPKKVRGDIERKDSITIIYHDGKELFEVTADLKYDDASKFGAKVTNTKRRVLKPRSR